MNIVYGRKVKNKKRRAKDVTHDNFSSNFVLIMIMRQLALMKASGVCSDVL